VPERMRELQIPGAAIALIRQGHIAAIRSFGYAELGQQQPVTDKTLFRMASISKPVAAWAVMILVERGLVGLDEPIDHYLRRWRLPPSAFSPDGVTLRRLLSHTAGISSPGIGRARHGSTTTPLLDGLEGRQPPLNAQQQRYYMRWGLPPDASITLAHEPGTGHRYSNGGYALLELMIEEVTGYDYADFVGREILSPLGLRHAGYDPLPVPLRATIATPHFEDGSPIDDWQPLSNAAGGMWASITDLATFACAELTGPAGALPGRGVLSSTSIDTMFASHGFVTHEPSSGANLDIGLGHFLCNVGGLRNVHHSGGFSGWRSTYSIFPQTGQGFCMLINSDGGNGLWQPLMLEWAQVMASPA